MKALGIGTPAPTPTPGGSSAYLNISGTDTNGSYAVITDTITTGSGTWAVNGDIGGHYAALQYFNSGATAQGSLQPDSARLLTSAPNGLQIESDESTGTDVHAPIGLWSNNTEVAWLTDAPGGAGSLYLPLDKTYQYSAIAFGDGVNAGAFTETGAAQLMAGSGHNAFFSSGEYYNPNTGQWIASHTAMATLTIGQQANPPMFGFYTATGLTQGSPVTGNTEIAALSVSGLDLIAGMYQTASNPTQTLTLDNSPSPQVVVPNGGHVDIVGAFSGMAIITGTDGWWGTATYLCGNSSATLIGQSVGWNYASNTTAPAAGQVSMGFDPSSGYAIYNNSGAQHQWDVMLLRTRAAP
jgi:hypothetical protein